MLKKNLIISYLLLLRIFPQGFISAAYIHSLAVAHLNIYISNPYFSPEVTNYISVSSCKAGSKISMYMLEQVQQLIFSLAYDSYLSKQYPHISRPLIIKLGVLIVYPLRMSVSTFSIQTFPANNNSEIFLNIFYQH